MNIQNLVTTSDKFIINNMGIGVTPDDRSGQNSTTKKLRNIRRIAPRDNHNDTCMLYAEHDVLSLSDSGDSSKPLGCEPDGDDGQFFHKSSTVKVVGPTSSTDKVARPSEDIHSGTVSQP